MTTIEVSERLMDGWWDHNGIYHSKYHVQIKDHPGYWSCGRSISAAIGELVECHPEKFGIDKINFLGKNCR